MEAKGPVLVRYGRKFSSGNFEGGFRWGQIGKESGNFRKDFCVALGFDFEDQPKTIIEPGFVRNDDG